MRLLQPTQNTILVIVLATILVVVEVGAFKTRKALESQKWHPPSTADEGGSASIARDITAVFRRTLPALRIVRQKAQESPLITFTEA